MKYAQPFAALALLVFCTLSLVASSCAGLRYQLKPAELSGAALPMLERHDRYVNADATLDVAARTLALEDSADVRELLQRVSVDQRVLAGPLGRTLDRHDVYVRADPLLDPLTLSTALNGSAILRRALEPPPVTPPG